MCTIKKEAHKSVAELRGSTELPESPRGPLKWPHTHIRNECEWPEEDFMKGLQEALALPLESPAEERHAALHEAEARTMLSHDMLTHVTLV